MTTVNSCYWGDYQIRSLIESFKTYRLSWCLSFWRLSCFYSDRVQLEFKADQDREKIKGSILYNKRFQSDPISHKYKWIFSFFVLVYTCMNYKPPVSYSKYFFITVPFYFTSVTCLAFIYWYNILLKQWKRCLNFHVLIQLPWVRPQCYLG